MTMAYVTGAKRGVEISTRFNEPPVRYGMGDVIELMSGLEAALSLAVYDTQFGLIVPSDPTIDEVRRDVRDIVKVKRISYASPLEIVLSVSVGIGALAYSGNRLLDMFNNFQDSRMMKATADLHVTAVDVVRNELTNLSEMPDSQGKRELIDKAATVVRQLSNVEVRESS